MAKFVLYGAFCFLFGGMIAAGPATSQGAPKKKKEVRLGNFSVSLTVKDLGKSREFYEKLGFHHIGGDGRRWVILQNETSTIGLFQGMFKKNLLTFNPGWDRNSKTLEDFDDVRDLQKMLVERGVAIGTKADDASTGPAHFAFEDPDGNPILVDQHVAKPKK